MQEVAVDAFPELEDHIAANLDHFADVVEQFNLRAALYLKATAAIFEKWWLGSDWPELVDALLSCSPTPGMITGRSAAVRIRQAGRIAVAIRSS